MISSFNDFRGGFLSQIPSHLMEPNELLVADNVVWDQGLRQRGGFVQHNVTALDGVIVGSIRTHLLDRWDTIIAVSKTGVGTRYYYGDTTFIQIGSFTQNETDHVRFGEVGGYIVATNANDKPVVITNSGGNYSIGTLDAWNLRKRSSPNIAHFTPDVSGYIETTGDMESAIQPVAVKSSNGNQWVIAGDYTFNRVEITGLTSCASGTTATIEYSDEDTGMWQEFDAADIYQDIDWVTGGTQILRFRMPFSNGRSLWGSSSDNSQEYNKYIRAIRITISSATTTVNVDTATVYVDEYVSALLGYEYPKEVAVYDARFGLAVKSNVFFSQEYSPLFSLKIERFPDGGNEIMRMITSDSGLIILKDQSIWTFTASTDRTTTNMISNVGTIARNSPVLIDNIVYFLSSDGIRATDGSNTFLISSPIDDHVPRDINAAGLDNDRWYLLSFPSNATAITFDVDSSRRLKNGDFCMSFFRYLYYGFTNFLRADGTEDSGHVFGLYADTIYRLNEGTTDDGTPIEMHIKTIHYTFSSAGNHKMMSRVKPEVEASGTYQITFSSDHGERNASYNLSFSEGSSGVYQDDVSLPYTMDGRSLSIEVYRSEAGGVVYAFHIDHKKRVF